jgi:hypothetical protein
MQSRGSFAFLCLIALFAFAAGCATTQTTQRKELPRFGLHQEAACLRFLDRRSGLRFCVPTQTQIKELAKEAEPFGTLFEARFSLPLRGLSLWMRKDALPPDTTEEALAEGWLLRYGYAYAQRRGAEESQIQAKALHPKRCQALGADTAAWLSFAPQDPAVVWEEVLILTRFPQTRYLLSIRYTAQARQPERFDAIYAWMQLFLRGLRFEPPKKTP